MENVFFSVIIPVYNASSYLEYCVSSVLSQTFRNFEIILINDGSSDTSGTLCDSYAARDARVRVMHQANKGVSVSRNVGIENATGRYIVFVDADDAIGVNRLEMLFDAADKTGSDVVISDFETFDSQSLQTTELMRFSPNAFFEDFLGGNWAVVWRLCIGKESLKGLRFLGTISYGEDYLFACQVLCSAQHVHYVRTGEKDAYRYRKNNSTSLMRQQKLSNVVEQCRATEYLEDYLANKKLVTPSIRKSLNKRKNWCRTLLFNESCTIFGMKRHFILLVEKKIYRFFLRKVFSETKE
jgi:Glycosyltransferases involved in cell wall biogenesis